MATFNAHDDVSKHQSQMNSLGLEYASSSDEEVEHAASPPPAPAAPPAEAPVEKPTAKSDDAPVKPSQATASEPAQAAVTASVHVPDVSMDDEDEEAILLRAGIPPAAAPLGEDSETQQRIERFMRLQRERGQDFQTTLQDKKEVRNPYILEKVVEYFGIDELRSNFPPEVFDPHGLPLHEFTDVLAVEQKKRADARAQRQLQQQRAGADPRQIHFASSNGR